MLMKHKYARKNEEHTSNAHRNSGGPANTAWNQLYSNYTYILMMYSAYHDGIELNQYETTTNKETVFSIPARQDFV